MPKNSNILDLAYRMRLRTALSKATTTQLIITLEETKKNDRKKGEQKMSTLEIVLYSIIGAGVLIYAIMSVIDIIKKIKNKKKGIKEEKENPEE